MPGASARRFRGTLDAGHGSGSGIRVRETTTRKQTFWIRSPLVSFFFVLSWRARRLGPSTFPGTAPDTRLQDFLACKPGRSYGLGQRVGRNSQGQNGQQDKYSLSASAQATKGLGRWIAGAHGTYVEPQTAAWAAKAPKTAKARHKYNQLFSLDGEKGDRPGKE